MSLRFIAGPPGSGKTTRIVEEAARQAAGDPGGPPVIVITPEQATFQTEQALLAHPCGGRVRVYSFARLASWIQSLRPSPSAPAATDTHRDVLAAAIVARLRRADPPMPLFATPRIDRAVAALARELKGQRLRAEDLERAAAEAAERNPALASKLAQLATAARAYDDAVRGRFQDPETTRAEMRREIENLPELQGAHAWIDALYGATPIDRQMIAGLLHRCASVAIAVPVDAEAYRSVEGGIPPRAGARDWAARDLLRVLLDLAKHEGIRVDPPTIVPAPGAADRFAPSPALAFLAARFLDRRDHSCLPGPPEGVRFLEAPDPRGEARAAVRQLVEWRQQGMRWGRMAVVARQLDAYAVALQESLEALGIPHFIDRREPLATHPLIQGTLAALEAVFGAMRPDALLAFAKSGLHAFPAADIALLEDFHARYPRSASAWLSPDDWQEPPSRSPFEEGTERRVRPWTMERIDKARRAVVEPLRALRAELPGETVRLDALARALVAFWDKALPRPGRDEESVLREACDLLASMAEAGGEEEFETGAALELVRETLGRLTLPRIPPLLDEVLVGQVDRLRAPTVQGAIVLGLAEGQFPAPGSNRSLLTDAERDELLDEHGLEFEMSSRRLFLREPFLAWIAMSRASDRLVLLRPLNTADGAPSPPSPWWLEARRRLPHAEPERVGDALSWDGALLPREAAAVVCREVLGAHEPDAARVASAAAGLGEGLPGDGGAQFRAVARAADSRNEAVLSPDAARAAYGDELRTSVTGLESFADCPFKHFARAVLRPEVRMKAAVTAADLGNLGHAVLKSLADDAPLLLAGSDDLAEDDPSVRGAVEAAFKEPRRRLAQAGILDLPGAGLAADELLEHLVRLVHLLRRMGRQLATRILHAEHGFGREGEGEMRIEAQAPWGPWTITLRGQIDRVDHFDGGVVVFDYKSSARPMDWPRAVAGGALQLPVYLLVADALFGGEGPPVGAFFVPIVARDAAGARPRGIARADAFAGIAQPSEGKSAFVLNAAAEQETKGTGDSISSAQFAKLLGHVRAQLADHGAAIAAGRVEVAPLVIGTKTPCTWCDYREACRLDLSINRARRRPSAGRVRAVEACLGPAAGEDQR